MKIQRFEDIEAWKGARELTKSVYAATKRGAFAKDFGLAQQIQRAAVSVMSNIAEGFERRSRREFKHFLEIALGSCGEVRSQLYAAEDQEYLSAEDAGRIRETACSVSRQIFGFIKFLEANPKPRTSHLAPRTSH